MTHKVIKNYMRFNEKAGEIDYCEVGDFIQPRSDELKEFGDCFEIVKIVNKTNKSRAGADENKEETEWQQHQ